MSHVLGSSLFFGGPTPLYADFAALHVFDMCETLREGCVQERSESIAKWMQRMRVLPGVREYLTTRPPLEDLGIHRQKKQ